VRVVDFTLVLAGRHCTKALRDLGADVTKIEPPSGDLGRVGLPYVSGIGLYFVQQNAGKQNLSLDFNYPQAREIVTRLCREADVIVENFRPSTLARFGFGHEDVRAFNPRVVYVSLSGYGQSTSWKNRPAFAPTVQAETGLTAIVQEHFGEALSEPRGDSCSHADVYTGLQGVIAVLAALQHRNRTGRGAECRCLHGRDHAVSQRARGGRRCRRSTPMASPSRCQPTNPTSTRWLTAPS
jgi:crotonobetainyl-CoA:carnitine CoA-transferase CaiB-like acyl-CoA transferase